MLRPFDLNRDGSTSQLAAGSNTVTSAGEPRRSVPPGSLKTRAGAHDMRSIEQRKVDDPRRHEPRDVHRERRLEPDDAVRRVGELALLLVVVVRRVIGRDEIDRSVAHRLLQRGDVVRRAQRRIHLRVRVVALDRVFGQRDVMRTDLGGHVDSALLAPANQLDRSARAHVAEVNVSARATREQNVADRHDLFGFGRNSLEAEPRADDALRSSRRPWRASAPRSGRRPECRTFARTRAPCA